MGVFWDIAEHSMIRMWNQDFNEEYVQQNTNSMIIPTFTLMIDECDCVDDTT